MFDADFDDAILFDNFQDVWFDWTGFAQQDADEGDIDETGPPIFCSLHGISFGDPPRSLMFHEPLTGGLTLTASVRDAMDTLLAAHPEIEYFTIEPITSLGTYEAVNFCGTFDAGLLYGYDADEPPWDGEIGVELESHFGQPGDEPQSYKIDGTPVDIAVQLIGRGGISADWFVFESWGPRSTDYPDDPGTYLDDAGLGPSSAWGQLGISSARQAYLLRPTALTWPGQDATNTANRIFWRSADVAGDEEHHIAGEWGHLLGSSFVKLRGWVKISSFIPRNAGAFTIGDPVGGRLRERNRVAGSQLEPMSAVTGNAYDGTTTGIGSSSADDGSGGVVR